MKKLILTLSFILTSSFVFAQKDDFEVPSFQIDEVQKDMSKGFQYGLLVEMPDIELKDAEKSWKSDMKDRKAKVNSSRGETSALGSSILNISRNKMDVYAIFDRSNDVTTLTAFFDLGDNFINSTDTPEEYEAARNFVHDFAVLMVKQKIEGEFDAAQKELSKSENKLEKLKKENDNLHSDIEKYKENIIKAEKDIEQNEVEQNETEKEIDNNEDIVKFIKSKLDKFK
ncbi:MAG: hypothetical protein R2798_10025 [Chitinophagales bacterium]|nr:hypothetical protein [Bacteroidota bacterium]MCB9044476.1 hypothetical protein [Chitinophagales bacterium]